MGMKMKDWMDAQKKSENDMLNAIALQAKEVAEELIPQVRLCALENEMTANIVFRVNFEFKDEGTDIWSEGIVEFPAKQSTSTAFRIDVASDEETSEKS
jgi:hypothetical protein